MHRIALFLPLLLALLSGCKPPLTGSEAFVESERTRAAGSGDPKALSESWQGASKVLDRRCVV